MKKITKAMLTGVLSIGFIFGAGVNSIANAGSDEVTVKAGSVFSLKENGKPLLQVQDSKGKNVNAKNLYNLPDSLYFSDDNTIHGYYVKYVDYDKAYSYKVNTSTQAYSKASTKNPLTSHNSSGKKIKIKIAKNTALSKVNSSWYKASIKYTDYKKSGTKWVKVSKKATVYVPASKVKTTTVWKKHIKEALNGYFLPWKREGIALSQYKQVKIGMTYEQVTKIAGYKGKLESHWSDTYEEWSDEDESFHTVTTTYDDYNFEAPWGDGSASFSFENNKLTYMSEYNLK